MRKQKSNLASPNIDQFLEFYDYARQLEVVTPGVGGGLLGSYFTQTPSEKDKILEKILTPHHVFQWFLSKDDFKEAIESLWNKSGFVPKRKLAIYYWLKLTGQISLATANYFINMENPDAIKIITKKYKKETLKPIDDLLNRLNNGIELLSISNTIILTQLLKELRTEIINNAPSIRPTRKSSTLPEQIVVQQIALSLHADYNEFMPIVIKKIIKVITPGIESRQIERYLKPLRDHLKAVKHYEAKCKIAGSLIAQRVDGG